MNKEFFYSEKKAMIFVETNPPRLLPTYLCQSPIELICIQSSLTFNIKHKNTELLIEKTRLNCTMRRTKRSITVPTPTGSCMNFLSMRNFYRSQKNVPKALADDLVNDVFHLLEKQEGNFANISSSECGHTRRLARSVTIDGVGIDDVKDEDADMDPRLKSWKKILLARKQLQQRIELRTGKRAEDVLFNRPTTIDEQSKRMMLNILDTARRHPGPAPSKEKGSLKGRLEECREVPELFVTEPKIKTLEFVGLPEVAQLELASTVDPPETNFQRSKVLVHHIDKQAYKIKEVLTYCPEFSQLQVSTLNKDEPEPVEQSKAIGEDFLLTVSSETFEEPSIMQESYKEEDDNPPTEVEPPTNWLGNRIKVNEKLFGFGVTTGLLTSVVELDFECNPMQRVRKTACNLENVGSRIIHVRWQICPTPGKSLNQYVPFNNEFMFDQQPFVLLPGDTRRIDVMYQPLWVGIKKQRWCMNMLRSPFCGTRRLYVRLLGKCTMPEAFRERLDRDQRLIVDKQKTNLTQRLTKIQAELSPIVENCMLKCPYERLLDERELFTTQNAGFKCDRYADLETLKQLYALVKKPRQPAWDFRLDTLRQCIYQHEAKHRESLQNILNEVLAPMRCSSGEPYEDDHLIKQQERSCFLYVRGLVCAAIEDWETLSESVGEQFFKSELQYYLNDLAANDQKMPKDKEYIEWVVSRKVLYSKFFKDALYVQTYTLLCDAAENIVSAIESTRKI